MAVKTFSNPSNQVKWENWGDVNAVSGDVASVADGDTFASPFSLITNAIFTPTTAVVVVPSFSGSTITFKVGSGTPTGRLTIIGR